MNDTAREPINLATTFGADPTVEVDVECSACRGTGLYVGMCENDGAAVVCVKCNGTGKVHMSLTPFTGRRKRDGVTRVFETNPGFIGLRGSDSSEGGISYEDWLAGKPFPHGSENRKRTCPFWWLQITDFAARPDWEECKCRKPLNRIDHCPHFGSKEKCWARWDKERDA